MTETKVSAYNHSGEAELLLLALMWSSSDQGPPAAKGSVVS